MEIARFNVCHVTPIIQSFTFFVKDQFIFQVLEI
jgi:hypothetical protein